MRMTSLLLVSACFGCFVANVNAAVLLGTVPFRGSMGSGGNAVFENSRGALTLLFLPNSGIYSASDCIGCSPYLAPGSYTDVTYDFTSNNSPAWNHFTRMLTHVTGETLFTGFNNYAIDGSLDDAGSSGTRASDDLFVSPAVISSVDSIQLDVTSLQFSTSQDAYSASFSGNWKIFGTLGPAHPTFPAPEIDGSSAGAAFTLLMGALAILRNRRRSSAA